MAAQSTGQHGTGKQEDAQRARIAGDADRTDGSVAARLGGDRVHSYGNLGAASSGRRLRVDMDEARQRLRDAQVALASIGYRIGTCDDPAKAVDGVWGPNTREAVSEFQRDHDLPEHGQLDGDTYEALLNAYEEGLSAQGGGQLEDDFSPIHASQPLGAGDLEFLNSTYHEPLDNSSEQLLSLQDDFADGEPLPARLAEMPRKERK